MRRAQDAHDVGTDASDLPGQRRFRVQLSDDGQPRKAEWMPTPKPQEGPRVSTYCQGGNHAPCIGVLRDGWGCGCACHAGNVRPCRKCGAAIVDELNLLDGYCKLCFIAVNPTKSEQETALGNALDRLIEPAHEEYDAGYKAGFDAAVDGLPATDSAGVAELRKALQDVVAAFYVPIDGTGLGKLHREEAVLRAREVLSRTSQVDAS